MKNYFKRFFGINCSLVLVNNHCYLLYTAHMYTEDTINKKLPTQLSITFYFYFKLPGIWYTLDSPNAFKQFQRFG